MYKNYFFDDELSVIDKDDDYPEILAPYKVLKISNNASHKETKSAFRRNLANTNRSSTCLAYEMSVVNKISLKSMMSQNTKLKQKINFTMYM